MAVEKYVYLKTNGRYGLYKLGHGQLKRVNHIRPTDSPDNLKVVHRVYSEQAEAVEERLKAHFHAYRLKDENGDFIREEWFVFGPPQLEECKRLMDQWRDDELGFPLFAIATRPDIIQEPAIKKIEATLEMAWWETTIELPWGGPGVAIRIAGEDMRRLRSGISAVIAGVPKIRIVA